MHPDTLACALCHDQCVSVCPIVRATGETTAFPSRKALLVLALERDTLDQSEAGPLFTTCIGCHLCREHCVWLDSPHDVGLVVMEARTQVQMLVPEETREHARRGGWDDTARGALSDAVFAALTMQVRGDNEKLVIWPDPVSVTKSSQMVYALCQLALRAGLSPVVIDEPLPSGLLALQCGDRDTANQQAHRAVQQLREAAETGTVLATSPADIMALRDLTGSDVPVRTTVEWLAELMERKSLKLRVDPTPVTFQDPSSLARGIGDVTSARKVLSAIAEQPPLEMALTANLAQPAAAEGLAPLVPVGVLEQLSAARLRDAEATGASVLITADPYSYQELTANAVRRGLGLVIKDLAEWVLDHVG